MERVVEAIKDVFHDMNVRDMSPKDA
jgi:hypothetical protein